MYECSARRINLGTDLSEANVRWLLAHELGHHLNGDCREGVAAQEMAANERAIQVLQTWGLSDYAAARTVARMLWMMAKERTQQGYGHLPEDITSTDLIENTASPLLPEGLSAANCLGGVLGRGQGSAGPAARDRPIRMIRLGLTTTQNPQCPCT
jgi:hypothetical protein